MPSRGSAPFDLVALLDALAAEQVEYLVVGGVAASLYGSPRLTFDLDIVPRGSARNITRLQRALTAIHATIRDPAERILPITGDLLTAALRFPSGGQLRIVTDVGPIDILWRLHDGRAYDDLLADSTVQSDDERTVRVIGKQDLVQVKRAVGRPQDLEDVRYLERIGLEKKN